MKSLKHKFQLKKNNLKATNILTYDIFSFDKEGNEKYIEVKTTNAKESASLFITTNELAMSQKNPEQYYLYRVYNFDTDKLKGD